MRSVVCYHLSQSVRDQPVGATLGQCALAGSAKGVDSSGGDDRSSSRDDNQCADRRLLAIRHGSPPASPLCTHARPPQNSPALLSFRSFHFEAPSSPHRTQRASNPLTGTFDMAALRQGRSQAPALREACGCIAALRTGRVAGTASRHLGARRSGAARPVCRGCGTAATFHPYRTQHLMAHDSTSCGLPTGAVGW